jgi:carbonic anhydrase
MANASAETIMDLRIGDIFNSLLAKIKPAIAATTSAGERTSKNYAFVDSVARRNVELTMTNIRRDSPVLSGMESSGAIKIAGAMYDLKRV